MPAGVVFHCTNLADLKTTFGNFDMPYEASILGIDYPTSQGFAAYNWDSFSTATADDFNAVAPAYPAFATTGRWLRSANYQVQADWNASIGYAHILNKPSLATVATSGSYSDLSGKPTIPAAQVSSDWNSVSGVSQILNKPSLATVATTGAYNDLTGKPTIPAAANLVIANPTARTLSLATAYQATDNTKPAFVTITVQAQSAISLAGASNNEGQIVFGSTNTVASGTGTSSAYKNNLGGGLVIGLNLNSQQANTYVIPLPAGWYFAVIQTAGSGLQIVGAFDQKISA